MGHKWDGGAEVFTGYSAEPKAKAKLYYTAIRATIWAKTDGRCWYCGLLTNPWKSFCIDHVVPERKDGQFSIGNLVPCCRACNTRKKGGTVKQLRESYARWTNQPSYTFYFETIEIGKAWAEAYLKSIEPED